MDGQVIRLPRTVFTPLRAELCLIFVCFGVLAASAIPEAWLPLSGAWLLGVTALAFNQAPDINIQRWTLWLCTFIGGVWVDGHWQHAQDTALQEAWAPRMLQVVGHIESVRKVTSTKVTRNKGSVDKSASDRTAVVPYTQFVFAVDKATDDSTEPLPQVPQGLRIQARCYRCPLVLKNGERWQLWLKLKPVVSFKNPGGFDYRQWLLTQGLGAQGYVVTNSQNSNVRLAAASQWQQWVSKQRDRVQTLIKAAAGSGFLQALLLGDKNGLNAEQKRLMMHAGLGHLFVVSGLHVGLVAALFTLLLQPFLRPWVLMGLTNIRPVAWLAGAACAGCYAALSGFQVPAMRAFLMAMLALWFFLSRRHYSPLSLLVFALLVVILIEPLAFKSMGSWLSFGIVASLIWAFWGRGQLRRISGWFVGLFKSQYYAFCAGALVLVAFAVPVSVSGIVLNLVCIPLFTLIILPLAMLGLVLGLMTDGVWLLGLAGQSMSVLFEILELGQSALRQMMSVQHEAVGLAMLGLFLMMLPLSVWFRVAGLVAFLTGIVVPSKPIGEGSVLVTVLDVGQGSSALIRTQHYSMLVDTGQAFMSGMTLADFVVMPFLRRQGVTRLDRVLVSHDDQDHSGGVDVLTRWGPAIGELTRQQQCDAIRWEWDGVHFEQMQAAGFQAGNNGSCLLKVSTDKGSILFTGDIESEAEQQLVASGHNLRADVLIVPHHGSRTSSSSLWLSQVQPTMGIISAGRFNRYGHPHPEVVARYQARNVALLGTHSHGAIEVALEAGQKGIKVSTYAPSTVTFLAR